MKKLLLTPVLLATFSSAFAQTEQVFYYYKGEKMYAQVNYRLLAVGLKKESLFARNKNSLADQLQAPADSVKQSSTANEFIVRLGAAQQAAGKQLVQAIGKKSFITYVHPALTQGGNKEVTYGDAFVVKLKPGVSSSRLNATLTTYHCAILKQSPGDKNTYQLSAGAANNYDALKMANVFFETGLFEFAEPDFSTHNGLLDAPNDPLYNLQWAHHNTGTPEQYNGTPGDDMQVDSAWLITQGDAALTIAVIDTGVDSAHVDLKKNLVQGYDCISQTSNSGDGAPRNLADAHGTACAGIAAATANNNTGIAGIAPKCKIMPVLITNENDVFASDFAIAGGIDYAWQHGADVLTNSWTLGMPSSAVDAAIHRAVTQGRSGKGCVVFAAAGNDNAGIEFPASNPELIAVGGSNMRNQHKTPKSTDGEDWWGANYGDGLSMVAPCVKIATTDISGANGYNTTAGSDGDYYLIFNGTSSASPNAAGVALLVLSVDKNLTAAQVRNIMESSCTKASDYSFSITPKNYNGTWNNEMGYGVVNAYKSVLTAQSKKFCSAGIATPSTTTLCKNGSIKLQLIDSNATVVYTWRRNGSNYQTGNSITVSQPGAYDVVANFSNGCTAYTAAVTIAAADTAALQASAGKPVSLCAGSTGAIIGGAPSASGGTPFVAAQRAYGFDILHNAFIRFNTENTHDYKYTPVGRFTNGANTTQFAAGEFTPMGYYMLTRGGQLVKVDTANGDIRLVANLTTPPGQYVGHTWSGLAWSPLKQRLYGITSSSNYFNVLYSVDPVTYKTTAAGGIENNYITWMAFSKGGKIYGFNSSYNTMVTIDTVARYGIFASDYIGVRMMADLDGGFDPLNGKLYLSTYGYAQSLFGDLREIDTLTKKVAVKGEIAGTSEVAGLAIAGGTYKYAWSPPAGLSNPNDANPIANPASTTTYTLTVTDACGAQATSQVVVTAHAPKPPITITANKDSICLNDSSRLVATKNPNYFYQWTFNGTALPHSNDSFYVANQGGKYQLTVTNGPGGCVNSKTYNLKDCSIWMTDGNTAYTCYTYFYPPKGPIDTSYRPNTNIIKVIYPENPSDRLKITFNKIGLHGVSSLVIYDGDNINAPVLTAIDPYDDTYTNLSFTSSTGPLTFQLQSSGNEYDLGTWDAFLTCYTPHVYRSRQSGDFDDSSTWEIKTGINTFEKAVSPPMYIDDSIIIRKGHTVTDNNRKVKKVDEVWVQKGAKLVCNNNFNVGYNGKFGLTVDGDIEFGDVGYLYGAGQANIRGNLKTRSRTIIGIPIYADGTAPQVFDLGSSLQVASLHVLNKTSVTINGKWMGDSLFMNTAGAGKLVADTIVLSHYLSLTNGIVELKNKGIADFTGYSFAAINGGNEKSYIKGPVMYTIRYFGSAKLVYPIGSGRGYGPITFDLRKTKVPFGDTVKVQVIDSLPPSMPLAAGIDKVSSLRYYKVQTAKNYTVDSARVTMLYNKNDGVTNPANLRIARDSASSWVDAGGHGVGTNAGSIVSGVNFTSFSNLVLANAKGGSNTLPVIWLQFTATPQKDHVLLQWQAAGEVNCAYYALEHSMDGRHFTPLARHPAYASSSYANSYQYIHISPVAGINYYRIKEIDKDGKYMYSKTISINVTTKANYSITPNPTKDEVTVTSTSPITEIDCYNALGQLVKKTMPANSSYKLSLKQFPAGVYTVRVLTAVGIYNSKVIKQ